jgi:hypothetical protein
LTKNKTILLLFVFISPLIIFSQVRVSASTDASIMRSFKEDQRFWAFGQTVIIDWQFTSKGGAYASVSYYSNGNYTNNLAAMAKSSATLPQQIPFFNKAQMRLEQISLGFKHYFVGNNDAQPKWSLYSITGFGLIFSKISNYYSVNIDTSLYNSPAQPVIGTGHFKRLTFDVGLGWEVSIIEDLYAYVNGKVWIPTSDYPSKYLLVNENAPLTGMISAGVRVLF